MCTWVGTAGQRLHKVPRDGFSVHLLFFRTGLYQKEGHVSGMRGQIYSDSHLETWKSTQESQGDSSRVSIIKMICNNLSRDRTLPGSQTPDPHLRFTLQGQAQSSGSTSLMGLGAALCYPHMPGNISVQPCLGTCTSAVSSTSLIFLLT